MPPGVTQRRTGRSAAVDIELHDGRELDVPLSLTNNRVFFAENSRPAVDLQSNRLDSAEIVEPNYPQTAALLTAALDTRERALHMQWTSFASTEIGT